MQAETYNEHEALKKEFAELQKSYYSQQHWLINLQIENAELKAQNRKTNDFLKQTAVLN